MTNPGAIALTAAALRRRLRLTGDPACPTCRGSGVARKSPYIVGLEGGDIYTMTACECAIVEERQSND